LNTLWLLAVVGVAALVVAPVQLVEAVVVVLEVYYQPQVLQLHLVLL
jgi:hypothetical protein